MKPMPTATKHTNTMIIIRINLNFPIIIYFTNFLIFIFIFYCTMKSKQFMITWQSNQSFTDSKTTNKGVCGNFRKFYFIFLLVGHKPHAGLSLFRMGGELCKVCLLRIVPSAHPIRL